MKRLKLLVLILISGCYGSDVEWPEEVKLVTNIPVVANTPNTFAYTVMADSMSDELVSNLNFDTTALILSLTLVQSEGTFAVEIYENDTTIGYEKVFTNGMVISEFPRFKPSKISLAMDDFTGSVELALTTEE